MHLGTRTFIASVLSVGSALLALAMVSEGVIHATFGRMEVEEAAARADTAARNLDGVTRDFRVGCVDWAVWDGVSTHLADPTSAASRAWEEENYNALAYQTKGWRDYVTVTTAGERGWSRRLLDDGTFGPVPLALDALIDGGTLLLPAGAAHSVAGLALLDGELHVVTSEPLRPVMPFPGEKTGALVVTERIDDAWVARLRRLTSLDITISADPTARTGPPRMEASDEEVVTHTALLDVTGRPVADVAVRSPRRLLAVGRRVTEVVLLGLAATSAAFVLLAVGAVRYGVTRRLEALSRGMRRLASGEVAVVGEHGTDEVGALARAFDGMARSVAEREAAIRRARAQVQLILDHTGDALVPCGRDGRIVGDVSRSARAWFGEPAGRDLGRYLHPTGPESAGHPAHGDAAFALPETFTREGRRYRVQCRPITLEDSDLRFLAVVRDITAEVEEEHRLRQAREESRMVARALRDASSFRRHAAACDRGFDAVRVAPTPEEQERAGADLELELRAVGAEYVATLVPAAALADVESAWRAALARVAVVCPLDATPPLRISPAEHETALEAFAAAGLAPAVLDGVRAWADPQVGQILRFLGAAAERVAAGLGKRVEVVIQGGSLRVDRQATAGLWTGLVHVVRNAVDHGVESSEERATAGKADQARIVLRAEGDATRLLVTVEDDGRGVDWERVRWLADERGLPHQSRADLVAALFSDRFSTRTEISELSGRGVGLAAAGRAVTELGGSLDLEDVPTGGTIFRASVPWSRIGRAPTSELGGPAAA